MDGKSLPASRLRQDLSHSVCAIAALSLLLCSVFFALHSGFAVLAPLGDRRFWNNTDNQAPTGPLGGDARLTLCKTFELYSEVIQYAHRQWGKRAPWPDVAAVFAASFDVDLDHRLSVPEWEAFVANLTVQLVPLCLRSPEAPPCLPPPPNITLTSVAPTLKPTTPFPTPEFG